MGVSRIARSVTVGIGLVMVGVVIGLLLSNVANPLGTGSSRSCGEVQNDFEQIRVGLNTAESEEETDARAAELFELRERRPECLSDMQHEMIEGFKEFLEDMDPRA